MAVGDRLDVIDMQGIDDGVLAFRGVQGIKVPRLAVIFENGGKTVCGRGSFENNGLSDLNFLFGDKFDWHKWLKPSNRHASRGLGRGEVCNGIREPRSSVHGQI